MWMCDNGFKCREFETHGELEDWLFTFYQENAADEFESSFEEYIEENYDIEITDENIDWIKAEYNDEFFEREVCKVLDKELQLIWKYKEGTFGRFDCWEEEEDEDNEYVF